MESDVQQVWESYRETADPAIRERLILEYAPLVKYVAGRVGVGMPSHVDHADLVSYGIFGLMDAIEKFDLDAGVKFETYAVRRIRGAIIDELRGIDWVPRSVRSKARKIERALSTLESDLGREPSDEELADSLDITTEELETWLEQVSYTNIAALDEALDVGQGEHVAIVDTLQDTSSPSPQQSLDDAEMKRLLRDAIDRLNEREQQVLALYYFEGMTLGQVGEILGVTESRVCQIHTKAVLRLRTKLTQQLA
ncbi:MAG: RNA polymerase sigma factor WhiG [Nitriliruptorales bacterium]|nr:RNA polymerase sigma factor WhiG [Nitriliruptorales bacterium]